MHRPKVTKDWGRKMFTNLYILKVKKANTKKNPVTQRLGYQFGQQLKSYKTKEPYI